MISQGVERTIVGVIGEEDILRVQPLEAYPGVERVIPVLAPYKLVSREFKPEDSVIDVKGVKIGGRATVVMAGPCAIERLDLLRDIAREVKRCGAKMLRGGAFKPRTSPYAFQGLGEEGLKMLKQVGEEFGLATVTEVMDPRNVELVARYADMLQIGARNMQNFDLLREVGKTHTPVLLKRGMMSTIKEFLMSAEYVLSEGNFNVVLCERAYARLKRLPATRWISTPCPRSSSSVICRSWSIPVMPRANGDWSIRRAKPRLPRAPTG